jgi:DNA-binding GntR family transcriptional regulator
MLNPKSIHPAWLQVARILESRIRSGFYPAEEKIPSEAELMSEFSIGRTTARLAVNQLRDWRLVQTIGSRGSYVVKEIPPA